MNIKTNDTITVLSGRDKGKQGKVIKVIPKAGKIIAQGISVARRHQKPRKQGEPGGIIDKETPIYACKVMRVCPKCDKPTKPAHGLDKNGEKVRICKKCNAEI